MKIRSHIARLKLIPKSLSSHQAFYLSFIACLLLLTSIQIRKLILPKWQAKQTAETIADVDKQILAFFQPKNKLLQDAFWERADWKKQLALHSTSLGETAFSFELYVQNKLSYWSTVAALPDVNEDSNTDNFRRYYLVNKGDPWLYYTGSVENSDNEIHWRAGYALPHGHIYTAISSMDPKGENAERVLLDRIEKLTVEERDNTPIKTSWLDLWILCLGILCFYAGLYKTTQIPLLPIKSIHSSIALIAMLSWVFIHFGLRWFFSHWYSQPPSGNLASAWLVLDSIFLFSLSIFLLQFKVLEKWQQKMPKWFPLYGYFFILGCILGLCYYTRYLLSVSDIPFDFENIFSLNGLSVLGMGSVLVNIFSIFLWSLKFARVLNNGGYTKLDLLVQGSLTLVALLLITYLSPLQIPILQFFFIVTIYLLVLDIFQDLKSPNLTWVVLWMVIISSFSSVLLYHFNRQKESNERTRIAKALVDPLDTVAINEVLKIFSDSSWTQEIRGRKAGLRNAIRLKSLYLQTYYDVVLLNNKPEGLVKIESLQNTYRIPNRMTTLYMDSEMGMIRLETKQKDDLLKLPSVVRPLPFKGIEALHKYEYAVYYKRENLDRTHSDYSLFLDESKDQPASTAIHPTRLAYQQGDWTAIISKPFSGIIRPLSLFSFLFLVSISLLAFIMLLDRVINFLPADITIRISRQVSLRNRIQLSVLTMIVASFAIIAVVTASYFRNNFEETNKQRLRKTAINIQNAFRDQRQISDLRGLHSSQLEQIALQHQSPIHLYEPDGNLLTSSDRLARHRSVIPKQLPFKAHQALANFSETFYLEEPNSARIATASVRLIDQKNRLLGFASIPYYTNGRRENVLAKAFIGTLLNVYVFLLLVAGAIALAVSNSITKPISALGQKLREFSFDKTNQPLEWKADDEFGQLIQQYNQMIVQLERSAQRLALKEREVAWREMAKQVAHEIKNPLTPMKLSIQHLEFAAGRTDEREQLNEMIKRSAKTLIEQIDNLTRIASEFSNFAKIPVPVYERIVLNDLVASVHDLFKKRDDIEFHLYVPIDELYVMADKMHLLRVLNNLLKNAIQAIPKSRRGLIEIKLEEQECYAVLSVKDNGKGIAKETQPKVFYPNFTTKSSGTGLGLAICKNIIEAIDGEIYFETQWNEGTTFFVRIPLCDQKEGTKHSDALELDLLESDLG